jgi:hypothetical protein
MCWRASYAERRVKMLEVINWVLEKCRWSLEKATSSKRFAELILKEAKINAIDAKSDEGIARNVGHLVMGKLLNIMPEKFAILAAKKYDCQTSFSTEERALIRFCGEAIVEGAKECLPEEVVQMAERWKIVSAEEQLEIAHQLYLSFRSENQETHGTLSTQGVMEKIRERNHKDRMYDDLGYLPGLYGKWDREKCWANCQGKMQMLVAFARLAGAETIVVHPLAHARDMMYDARTRARGMIYADLRARNLEDGCEEFAESMSASFLEDLTQRDSFHVGMGIRLCDESWVMIDPHGLCWGKFSPAWNLDQTLAILKKYGEALPGLTMSASDGGDAQRLLEKKYEIVQDMIERSRKMEKLFGDRVKGLADLIDVLFESEDFELLLRMDQEEKGREIVDLSNPDLKKYFVMAIVMGGQDKIWDVASAIDPDFLKKRIRMWLTFYHANAINLFLNLETDAGKMIHPVADITVDAEWSIAVSAINSASFRVGRRGIEAEQFFTRNSFDQTTLANAASDRFTELGKAARETLRALPILHPISARKSR